MSIERTRYRSHALTAAVLGVVATLAVLAGVEALHAARASGSTSAPAPSAAPSPARPHVPPRSPLPVRSPLPAAATARTVRPPWSSAELPPGPAVPVTGAGTWRVVPGTSSVAGTGELRTYTVEVEDGVNPPAGDAAFANAVEATLADPRSWIAEGQVAWQRVSSGQPRLRIRLASQRTARHTCGYEIPVDVSCYDGGVVTLSAARWIRGAVAYRGDLAAYRQYMVNHEVGHSIGKRHRPCPGDGAAAPTMMQQTFSTSNDEIVAISTASGQGTVVREDGKVCTPNPWPAP